MLRFNAEVLWAALRSVAYAASKDESRAHLAAMHFARVGEQVRLTCTDGHWLARWLVSPLESSEDGPLTALFHIGDILDSLRQIKRNKLGTCDVHLENGAVWLSNGVRFTWRPVLAEFPPVDKVMPRFTGAEAPIRYLGFSPHLMRQAVRVFPKEATVRAQFMGLTEQIYMTTDTIEGLEVVLMPARVDEPTEADAKKRSKKSRKTETADATAE